MMTNSIKFISKILIYIFSGFSLNKSKIGQPKNSPIKDNGNYNIDMMSSTFSENGKGGRQKFYYEANNE